jgi:hypothetical protein
LELALGLLHNSPSEDIVKSSLERSHWKKNFCRVGLDFPPNKITPRERGNVFETDLKMEKQKLNNINR